MSRRCPAQQLRPDGRRLTIAVDTFYILHFHDGDTVDAGRAIDVLLSDGRLLTRVHDQTDLLFGRRLDTTVMRLPDLRPVSRVSVRERKLIQVQYGDDAVRGWSVNQLRETTTVNVRLPSPAYHDASYDLVIRASELANDSHLDVLTFLVGENQIGTPTGRVLGSDTVDGVDCWLFQSNYGGLPMRFWIDKRTRALQRQLIGLPGTTGALYVRQRRPRIPSRGT